MPPQQLAHSLRFDSLLSFLYKLSFVFVVLEVSSALAFKICHGCVPPRRFLLCFHCSVWASLFYGFTADVSECIY